MKSGNHLTKNIVYLGSTNENKNRSNTHESWTKRIYIRK